MKQNKDDKVRTLLQRAAVIKAHPRRDYPDTEDPKNENLTWDDLTKLSKEEPTTSNQPSRKPSAANPYHTRSSTKHATSIVVDQTASKVIADREFSKILRINRLYLLLEKNFKEHQTSITVPGSTVVEPVEASEKGTDSIFSKQFGYLDQVYSWRKEIFGETFEWDDLGNEIVDQMNKMLKSLTNQTHIFDIQLIYFRSIQMLFPLDMIRLLTSKFHQQLSSTIGSKALIFQSYLLEVFVFHHLQADTKFNSKLVASDLSVIPPFARESIRERNRQDTLIKDKYFGNIFDIKKFVYKLLELYFPNTTEMYLKDDHKAHKWIFKLILTLFEIGLWCADEMDRLVTILFQKFENLDRLERKYDQLKKEADEKYVRIVDVKPHFQECKEIAATIVVHVVVLIDDASFSNSFAQPIEAPEKTYWEGAFFKNSDISNLLFKTATSYLMKIDIIPTTRERSQYWNTVNAFLRLVVDPRHDIMMTSVRHVTKEELTHFYHHDKVNKHAAAIFIVEELERALFMLSVGSKHKVNLTDIYQNVQVEFEANNGPTLRLYLAEMMAMPILLTLICVMEELDVEAKSDIAETEDKATKIDSGEFAESPIAKFCHLLVQMSQHEQLCQVVCTSSDYWPHWKYLFKKRPLQATMLFVKIFEKNNKLLQVNRSRFKFFLSFFADFSLSVTVLLQKKVIQFDLMSQQLASYYSYCDFIEKFIATIDTDTEQDNIVHIPGSKNVGIRKFYRLMIQEILMPVLEKSLECVLLNTKFCTQFAGFKKIPNLLELATNPTPTEEKHEMRKLWSKIRYFNITDKTVSGAFLKDEESVVTASETVAAIFELAAKTVKLMSFCSQGLYLNQLFRQMKEYLSPLTDDKAAPFRVKLIERAWYLLKLQDFGQDAFTYLLQLYNNFVVFFSNGLLTNRLNETNALPKTAAGDTAKVEQHNEFEDVSEKDGIYTESFLVWERLKDIEPQFEELMSPKYTIANKRYYFNGVFPIIYKYCKGLFSLLHFDIRLLDKVEKDAEAIYSLLRIKEKNLKEYQIYFPEPVKMEEAKIQPQTSQKNSNQVAPVSLANKLPFDLKLSTLLNPQQSRQLDYEDSSQPQLRKIRDKLCEITSMLDYAYTSLDNQQDQSIVQQAKYLLGMVRNCPMTSSPQNLEPWDAKQNLTRINSHKRSIAPTIVDFALQQNKKSTFVPGSETYLEQHFKQLMKSYIKSKRTMLSGNDDKNMFLSFINDKKTDVNNLVKFYFLMVYRMYGGDKFFGELNRDNIYAKEEYKNIDKLVALFIQDEAIFALTTIFANIQHKSDRLREAMVEAMAENAETRPMILSVFSALCFVSRELFLISTNKLFDDPEKRRCFKCFSILMIFFKNLAEGNFTPFKKFFGEFKPKVGGLGTFNFKSWSMLEWLFWYLDKPAFYMKTQYSSITQLTNADRPEYHPALEKVMKFGTECCVGSYTANQTIIGELAVEACSRIVLRHVDYLNSTVNTLKSSVLDFLLAVTEGNTKGPCLRHGAAYNFEELFQLMCRCLKQLYIHVMIQPQNKTGITYNKLVRESKVHRIEVRKAESPHKIQINDADKIGFTNNLVSRAALVEEELQLLQTDIPEEYSGEIITDEMLSYIKIDNYENMLELYKKDPIFSTHELMKIALKAHELILTFSKLPELGGFASGLERLYLNLIDRYDKDVPIHIRKNFPNYKPNKHNVEAKKEKHVIYMFFVKVTRTLEVVNQMTNTREIVMFPRMPKTFFLSDQILRRFLQGANTDNMVVELIRDFNSFESEMNENLEMFTTHSLRYRITSEDTLYKGKIGLWIIGMLINLAVMTSFKRDSQALEVHKAGEAVAIVLAIICIVISGVFLVVWLLSRFLLNIKVAKRARRKVYSALNDTIFNRIAAWYKIYLLDSILKESYPLIFTIHIVSNILGVIYGPFFLTLQLLTLVGISKTANYVMKAITTHFSHIVVTVFLALIVIYCYSTITASYFRDTLINNQADNPDMRPLVCYRLWECLLYSIDSGLRNGGGIGDVTIDIDPHEESGRFILKFLFDLVFFMLINVISLNIIFGIIIDTFAAMREANDHRDHIIGNQCLVCLIKRNELESSGEIFERHIREEHRLWNYCEYLTYLYSKNREDQTGIEMQVWKGFQTDDMSWIPQRMQSDHADFNSKPSLTVDCIEKVEKKLIAGIDKLKQIAEDRIRAFSPAVQVKEASDSDLDQSREGKSNLGHKRPSNHFHIIEPSTKQDKYLQKS